MDKNNIPSQVFELASEYFGSDDLHFEKLPQSGSQRLYLRVFYKQKKVMAAFSENTTENRAFLTYLKHFSEKTLPVPKLYAVDKEMQAYLMEDLGDVSLFSLIPEEGVQPDNVHLISLYKKALTGLVRFQTDGHHKLDYSVAFPRKAFDEKAIRWDLNYFKYYFLHVSGIQYDENQLEKGFDKLVDLLLQVDDNFFMYRDFQARNIMIVDDEPRFIDFQGGRQGPPHYDVVSLLYQARAHIHPLVREALLKHYLDELMLVRPVEPAAFRDQLEYFKLVRTLQVLGAYGFRGFIEQKAHFLKSVPFALNTLRDILSARKLPKALNPLTEILRDLVYQYTEKPKKTGNLTVSVSSFSYLKAGVPADATGNGGGFVFDCRGLPNPGRHAEFIHLTGQDRPVIHFLQERNEVSRFIENIFRVVSQTIDNYIEREFEHLMINFGCTGGQHRSVYCAEKLAEKLKTRYDIKIQVRHYQQEQNKNSGYGQKMV